MTRLHALSTRRTLGFAAALFAITLNFLQPLAHAAFLRDGGTEALWTTAFCKTADDAGGTTPATKPHECCLGLAHATALAAPSGSFIRVEPVAILAAPSLPAEQPVAVGIRDGPSRPRGPPSFV